MVPRCAPKPIWEAVEDGEGSKAGTRKSNSRERQDEGFSGRRGNLFKRSFQCDESSTNAQRGCGSHAGYFPFLPTVGWGGTNLYRTTRGANFTRKEQALTEQAAAKQVLAARNIERSGIHVEWRERAGEEVTCTQQRALWHHLLPHSKSLLRADCYMNWPQTRRGERAHGGRPRQFDEFYFCCFQEPFSNPVQFALNFKCLRI